MRCSNREIDPRTEPSIVAVLGSYRRRWILREALAAVMTCAVPVPQALAYWQLAGLFPVNGLYAAPAPLVLLFASSRRPMVGPESALAILTALSPARLAAGGSARLAVLAAMLALLTGAVLILSGFARLTFLADFFSRPVLLGFISGAAVIIISQLPQLLAIKLEGRQHARGRSGAFALTSAMRNGARSRSA
jgi:SulP family sulfate permease